MLHSRHAPRVGALALCALTALAACGAGNSAAFKGTGASGGEGTGASGGAGTGASGAGGFTLTTSGTTTTQTYPPADGGTGGSSGDGCAAGVACGECIDRASCLDCNSTAHQAGVSTYNALLSCVFCQACYTTCGSAAAFPMLCLSAPTTMGACDGAMADTTACSGGTTNCQPLK